MYDELAYYYDEFVSDEIYDIYINLLIKYKKFGKVLDVGAGTARLSIKMASEGYTVTASDVSEDMLNVALENAKNANAEIAFYLYDMLDEIEDKYDIITAATDVINHIDEEKYLDIILKNFYEALNDEGILIFDFLKEDYVNGLIDYHEEQDFDSVIFKWDVKRGERPLSIIHNVEFIIDGKKLVETHYEQTFPYKTYEETLLKNNFKILECIELGERYILVCKKEKA